MTQEFCHTFNSLVDAKRQIVIAADVPPAQLDAIDQRMRSRLMGGLVVDIELPELDLRREILARPPRRTGARAIPTIRCRSRRRRIHRQQGARRRARA